MARKYEAPRKATQSFFCQSSLAWSPRRLSCRRKPAKPAPGGSARAGLSGGIEKYEAL
jgi:hypothetical protein